MSKGHKPRPLSVSYKEYSDNFEAIFGKKDEETEPLNELNEEQNIHHDEVDG